jgi:hypothetical protein
MAGMGRGPKPVLLGAALWCTLAGGALAQAGQWQTLDWTLPGRVRLARLIEHQGRPAVLATAPTGGGGGRTVSAQVLRVGAGQVELVAAWTLPGDVRWLEPLRLPQGQRGWLALRGDGWYLAEDAGGAFAWRRVCACPSVYGERDTPDPLEARFVHDLGEQGEDQLVLPDAEGLTVYRWVAKPGVLEPWWRYRWETTLLRDPRRADAWQLQRYGLAAPRAGGPRALVLHHAGHLAVYPHPGLSRPRYLLNGAARMRLESLTLPAELRRALAAMGDAAFDSVEALLSALPLPTAPKAREEWLASLPRALWALQAPPREVPLERLPLPGSSPPRAGDRAFVMALEDLTGDGVADLLQGVVYSDNSPLGLRGELRLYTGTEQDGRWSFAPAPDTLGTDGAAVAWLLRTGTAPGSPPALVVASTNATLGAILRTLSTGKARLTLGVHVLQAGRFPTAPDHRADLQLEGIASGARPLALAADLDGDGWREFLIGRKPDVLTVYPGSPTGPRIGAPALAELHSPLPRKPQEALAADLDGDGREELVFWYRASSLSETQRQTLRFVRWKD